MTWRGEQTHDLPTPQQSPGASMPPWGLLVKPPPPGGRRCGPGGTIAPSGSPRHPSRRGRFRAGGLAWAALAVVAIVITVAATSGSLPGPSSPPAAGSGTQLTPALSRVSGVTVATAELQRSWLAKNETALLARLDPADAKLRDRWRGMMRGAAKVGLSAVTFTVLPTTVVAAAARTGYDETASAAVAMRYALPSWDPSPVTTMLGLTFGRRADRWLLVDDVDRTDPPLGGSYEPWLAGDVGVARRADVMVVGDPDKSADNERLAGLLEEALGAVRATVPGAVTTWNGKVVAYASTDPTFVSSWFGTRADTGGRASGKEPATFAAEVRTLPANPVLSAGDEVVPATARVAVTPYLLTRGGDRAKAVLRHEITHVALAVIGRGEVPTWLVEGAAEYVAYREVSGVGTAAKVNGVAALDERGLPKATWQQLHRGTWKPVLRRTPQEFYQGSVAQVADGYTTAWLTCMYIAAHYGEAALFTLYARAAEQPVGQDGATVEATALRQVLDIDQASLLREVTAYARQVRSRFA